MERATKTGSGAVSPRSTLFVEQASKTIQHTTCVVIDAFNV